jgi:hypothetical protein
VRRKKLPDSTKPVVHAALVDNLLVVVTETVAAVWKGSSAMPSEAVYSFKASSVVEGAKHPPRFRR